MNQNLYKTMAFKNSSLRIVASIFVLIMSGVCEISAQDELITSRIKAAMRSIGHELLVDFQDTTGRVLPVGNIQKKYFVNFENDFGFDPANLYLIVNDKLKELGLFDRYLLEMVSCENKDIVYSQELVIKQFNNEIPCSGRIEPKGCYSLHMTILGDLDANYNDGNAQSNVDRSSSLVEDNMLLRIGLIIAFFLGIVFIAFVLVRKAFIKKKSVKSDESNLHHIQIGDYSYDPITMLLTYENESNELTGKEAELLSTLFESANKTMKRDEILQSVWGDEGDYVGRTLDVFISKLRKRLSKDPKIKIINIRGVGYKLVVT